MINAKICLFTNLLQVFLIFIFGVRWYNCAYLSCAHVPRPMKFTAFIDESAGSDTPKAMLFFPKAMPLPPAYRHLYISLLITAESLPLHIASNRARIGNLWVPSASR